MRQTRSEIGLRASPPSGPAQVWLASMYWYIARKVQMEAEVFFLSFLSIAPRRLVNGV